MADQSSLGGRKIHRQPDYGKTDYARVTSNKDYDKYGIIEVILLDYSKPMPVWIVGDIDRKPVVGDQVLIGYIGGRKDAPYLVGHVKTKSYTTAFIEVHHDRIRIQLPVLEVGKKDGKAHNDVKEALQNEGKLKERAYIELDTKKARMSFPVAEGIKPTHFQISPEGIEAFHPTGNFVVDVPNGILDVK